MAKGIIERKLDPGDDRPLVMETFAGERMFVRFQMDGTPMNNGLSVTDGRLPLRALPVSPNPGYPLPGHVMTNAHTAPGTEVWEKFQMNDSDW